MKVRRTLAEGSAEASAARASGGPGSPASMMPHSSVSSMMPGISTGRASSGSEDVRRGCCFA